MAKLLTLSFTETWRGEDGYHVIARDLDRDRWVMLHVPRNEFRRGDTVFWDLFAVTEVEIQPRQRQRRNEEYELSPFAPPRIVVPPLALPQRLETLQALAVSSVREVYSSPNYVGLVPASQFLDVKMDPKPNVTDSDKEHPFFWRAALRFADAGQSVEYAVKDMRWKNYWLDVRRNRTDQYATLRSKWLEYLNSHVTYLLMEIYPANQEGTSHCAVAAVHCLPRERQDFLPRFLSDDDVPF